VGVLLSPPPHPRGLLVFTTLPEPPTITPAYSTPPPIPIHDSTPLLRKTRLFRQHLIYMGIIAGE
jgi:hypothetical protein